VRNFIKASLSEASDSVIAEEFASTVAGLEPGKAALLMGKLLMEVPRASTTELFSRFIALTKCVTYLDNK
jgi:hypothetical protein